MNDARYLQNESHYLDLSYDAFSRRFESRNDFLDFYNAISSDCAKNEFLRVASFYAFLCRFGSWRLKYPNCDEYIDYIDSAYKLIGVISLIESLHVKKNINFADWCKKSGVKFPISDLDNLKEIQRKYNLENGSSLWFRKFFLENPAEVSKALLGSIKEKVSEEYAALPLERIYKNLYNWRSEFVHQGKLPLKISNNLVFSMDKSKSTITEMPMKNIEFAFEAAVIAHFVNKFDE